MKIFPVHYFNVKKQYTNPAKTDAKLFSNPVYDKVSFRSYELLGLPKEELYKKIQASLNPENFIGQGMEAEVYRIRDTNYCVRIPYNAISAYSLYNDNDFKKLYYNKIITPAEKVNHIVAKLSLGGTVMKYIEGLCPKQYIDNANARHKFQSEVAEFPKKSYTNFLHQISNGIDNEMLFDYSSGNLLINLDNKEITAIDFIPIDEYPREVKPLKEMYSVLTVYGAEQRTGKKIFENVMMAGLEELESEKTPCMDIELFDFIDLCNKRIYETNVKNIDKLMNKIAQQVDILKKLKKDQHLNNFFPSFVDEKISNIKNLIKYLR